MGRPLKEVDEAEICQMILDGCSKRDIAALIGVDSRLIRTRFAALWKQKRAERRRTLLQQQNEACSKLNPALLIFRGKNELEQVDKQQSELTGKGGGPIKTESNAPDYSKLSVEELKVLRTLSEKAIAK